MTHEPLPEGTPARLTDDQLDQWETSARADHEAGQVWSVNPLAILSVVNELRVLRAAVVGRPWDGQTYRTERIERDLAERLIEAIKRDGRIDLDWQREHKQNHEDLVRIVATEDAYNAAIRTIETEVGL
jgi:hypothetical protein